MEAENYYWIESLRDVRLEDIRSQKSEICGLTSEVLSMKFPSLQFGLLHGCDKKRLFYHRRAMHVIK